MSWLESFVGGGAAIDLVLAVVAAEAVLLSAYRVLTGGGLSLLSICSLLLPGVFLLLALKAALVNAGTTTLAICLVAALLAHMADLARRFEKSARRDRPAVGTGARAAARRSRLGTP